MSALNEALAIVLGCYSFLGAVALYFLSILISCFFLLGVSKFSVKLRTRSRSKAALVGNDLGLEAILSLLGLNALVVFLVILEKYDDKKYFWEAFWHAYVVALMVVGFLLPLEAICVGLASCYEN